MLLSKFFSKLKNERYVRLYVDVRNRRRLTQQPQYLWGQPPYSTVRTTLDRESPEGEEPWGQFEAKKSHISLHKSKKYSIKEAIQLRED